MLHNLLDSTTKKRLRNEYRARILVVSTLFATAVVAIGVLSNLPAYVYLRGELETFDPNALLTTATASEDVVQTDTQQAIEETNFRLGLLEQNLEKNDLADLLKAALSVRPEGVLVTGFSYSQPENTITVEGVAQDRDVFREYSQNLDAHPWFADVPQPISNLAKNTDLPFRLSFEIISPTKD